MRIDAYVDPAKVAIGDDAIIMGMPENPNDFDRLPVNVCFYLEFSGQSSIDDCLLHVPVGKESSFATAMHWARFKHIVGDLISENGIPGDVNGDGLVSGADVTALYGVLLDGTTPAGNPDVNNDGSVSGADITALYNLLLN